MPDPNIKLSAGDHLIVIRNRYETLTIVNDFLIGLWFLVGSFLFLSESTKAAGTVCFIMGSVELLIRPTIRLARNLHIKQISPDKNDAGSSTSPSSN